MTTSPAPPVTPPAQLLSVVAEKKQALGLTDQQLADKLGISRDAFLSRRSGRVKFTPDDLVALADLFTCTVDELLGR